MTTETTEVNTARTIGELMLDPKDETSALYSVIAFYYDNHPDRPEGDEANEDPQTGYSPWTDQRVRKALGSIERYAAHATRQTPGEGEAEDPRTAKRIFKDGNAMTYRRPDPRACFLLAHPSGWHSDHAARSQAEGAKARAGGSGRIIQINTPARQETTR